MVKVDQKTVLIVIDGWGVASDKSPKEGDAILAADTPTMDDFAKEVRTRGVKDTDTPPCAVFWDSDDALLNYPCLSYTDFD